MDITQLRNGGLKMIRMRFKTILCFSLILIPISLQTGSDLILSDNWAIKERTLRMKRRAEAIEWEIWIVESEKAIQLAVKEIDRDETNE